jgi:ABC-type lipoprotein export system ATPase subunit
VCLFNPGTPVSVLDEKLAQLGLPKSKRFESGKPRPLPSEDLTRDKVIKVMQEDESVPGLIILAHATGNSGVLDPRTIEQWWSADVIQDERLLCVELPHPRGYYLGLPDQPLTKSILQNRDSRYLRRHPIASICSSDCKDLQPSPGVENYIGFRHTWIKMAVPSIEGLRQAFLDHESRIRFGGKRPEDMQIHPRIESFVCAGVKFLRDQKIAFSPNLNVIIGGSGSGKSTVVNYLRMCLAQDTSIHGDDVKKNYDKSIDTITPSSRFEVEFNVEGEWINLAGQGEGRLSEDTVGSALGDLAKALPVRFYGQREIYNIAEDRDATRRLLDDLVRDDLDALRRRADELTDEIKILQVDIDRRPRLRRERDELLAEVRSTEAKISRLRDTAAPLAALSEATSRVGQLRALRQQRLSAAAGVGEALTGLREASQTERPADLADFLASLWEESKAALDVLIAAVDAAYAAYRASISGILEESDDARSLIRAERVATEQTEAIREELEEQGVDPGELAEYQAAVEAKRAGVQRIDTQLTSIDNAIERRALLIQELRDCWRKEIELRRNSARQLRDAVPETSTNLPFVEVSVVPYGDERDFENAVAEFRHDRRQLSDDDWAAFLKAVVHATGPEDSPIETLVKWISDLRNGIRPPGAPWELTERRTVRLLGFFDQAACGRLELRRVADRVIVMLRRQDGTEAGELEGGLSVGQKCTAVLAILLARDTAPAVIDQPEEEIDNEFTYREMVPLLRRVKERRQLIVVTHDPNIPVNADAEMILALEALGGRGDIKKIGGRLAVGALDQEHVRLAVEEIMEGSEEAFRRRYAKYGF